MRPTSTGRSTQDCALCVMPGDTQMGHQDPTVADWFPQSRGDITAYRPADVLVYTNTQEQAHSTCFFPRTQHIQESIECPTAVSFSS